MLHRFDGAAFVSKLDAEPYSETAAEVLDIFWCPLGERYLFDT